MFFAVSGILLGKRNGVPFAGAVFVVLVKVVALFSGILPEVVAASGGCDYEYRKSLKAKLGKILKKNCVGVDFLFPWATY